MWQKWNCSYTYLIINFIIFQQICNHTSSQYRVYMKKPTLTIILSDTWATTRWLSPFTNAYSPTTIRKYLPENNNMKTILLLLLFYFKGIAAVNQLIARIWCQESFLIHKNEVFRMWSHRQIHQIKFKWMFFLIIFLLVLASGQGWVCPFSSCCWL